MAFHCCATNSTWAIRSIIKTVSVATWKRKYAHQKAHSICLNALAARCLDRIHISTMRIKAFWKKSMDWHRIRRIMALHWCSKLYEHRSSGEMWINLVINSFFSCVWPRWLAAHYRPRNDYNSIWKWCQYQKSHRWPIYKRWCCRCSGWKKALTWIVPSLILSKILYSCE